MKRGFYIVCPCHPDSFYAGRWRWLARLWFWVVARHDEYFRLEYREEREG